MGANTNSLTITTLCEDVTDPVFFLQAAVAAGHHHSTMNTAPITRKEAQNVTFASIKVFQELQTPLTKITKY